MSGRCAANITDIQHFDASTTGGGTSANGSTLTLYKAADTSAAADAGHGDTQTLCLLAAVGALFVFAIICLARIRRLKATIRQLQPEPDTPAADIEAPDDNGNDEDDEDDDESYRPYENRSMEFDRIFHSRLDNLIEENLCNHDLSVDFLATKMLVSRSLLFRRVKRIAGKSVVEYINDFRINRAKELLADESHHLTEISELVGFSSLRYFSRVFKSVTGESPSVYRQQRPLDRQ